MVTGRTWNNCALFGVQQQEPMEFPHPVTRGRGKHLTAHRACSAWQLAAAPVDHTGYGRE